MEKNFSGKVRDIYAVDEKSLLLVTTNRVSAFDVVLPNEIPLKGEILTSISEFWFDFTKDIIPNHLISTNYTEFPSKIQEEFIEYARSCMLVKKLKMLPIECIVRGYITGSGWKSYQKNGSVCGIKLPDGLRESEKLPTPIYTPTTKVTEGHDEHITFEETVNLIGEDFATQVRDKSIEIYSKCSEYALTKGIIIADTKFEFGVDEDGNLVLADELFTPDSSRFWSAKDYKVGQSQKSFDKQYLRDWLENSGWNKEEPAPNLPSGVIGVTAQKYISLYEMLTGISIFT